MPRRLTRPRLLKPELTESQILIWADAFHKLNGSWPMKGAPPQNIPQTLGERWKNVDEALRRGLRGLEGGSSLARLLAEHRGVRNSKGLPPLSIAQILSWADAFHELNSWWPMEGAPPQSIPQTLGETWKNVDDALRTGLRGFEGGSSLARLLAEHRGVRNSQGLVPLSVSDILTWADAFHESTGCWPGQPNWYDTIPGTNGEKWMYLEAALQAGLRGLPGGSSLARLLAEHRGVRNKGQLARLTVEQIQKWAADHQQKTGKWPTCRGSGEVEGLNGEKWFNIDQALRKGLRGLPGGSSLAMLRVTQPDVLDAAT